MQKVSTRGLLVAVMNLCQEHRDAHRGKALSKKNKQIGKQERCCTTRSVGYQVEPRRVDEVPDDEKGDGGSRSVWTVTVAAG